MKIIIIILLLTLSSQSNASKVGDFIESFVDSFFEEELEELPRSSISISNTSFEDFTSFGSGVQLMYFKGRVFNKLHNTTIRRVTANIYVKECNSMGTNCTVIDQSIDTYLIGGIPPRQARFFDVIVAYTPGTSKHIYFSYIIDKIIGK